MKRLFTCFLWILLTQTSLTSQAQTLENQLRDFSESEVHEQLHLQLSESVVGAGESIWFQAAIINVDSTKELSRVVYLELFNRQQKVVARGVYPASYGIATGQLALPDSLAGGWYQLQAYTQYMRNSYSTNYFSQPMLVINTDLSNPSLPLSNSQPSLQLFPEGGNWVSNQENNVVALAYADFSGEGRLDVLQTFDSSVVAQTAINNGLGEFNFSPLADTSYVARLITSDTIYYSIPQAQSDGYSLQVSIARNHLEIKGQTQTFSEGAFLAIRTDNNLLHYQPIEQNPFSLDLLVSKMRGLVEIAILDTKAKTLARRLIYLHPENNQLSLNLSTQTVSPRENVSVTINSDTNIDQNNLSIAVRKLYSPKYPISVPLLDQFGLSELLIPEGVSAPQWINRWLVTQTAPWLSWSDMLTPKPSLQQFAKEDEMLLITGQVQTSQPINEGDRVLLSIPGDDPYFEYSAIAEDGTFAIPVSRVYGSPNSILQYQSATDDQPQSIQWTIDSVFASSAPDFFYPPYSFSDATWQQIVDGYRLRKRIQQTYYGLEEEETDSIAPPKKQFRFYGAPNVRVNPDDYISLPSFEEICRELLPGVRLVKRNKKYNFDVFDPGNRKFLPNEPTLFLDGVPIQNKDYIINFPPDQISYIETVNRRTYYGNVRLDGVIAVYTQQERAYEEALSGRALFTTLPYYTSSSGFSTVDSLPSSMPDFRTLLYWQPKINPESDEDFSFSTSDELGTYEVVIRGVDEQGQLIQERATFEVKPPDLP